MTTKRSEPERLSVAELQALSDEIVAPAWQALPPSTLTISEQEELLRYRWDISAAVEIGDPELVRSRSEALAAFLESKTREYQENHERRAAEVRHRTLAGIMVVKPGQSLAGPWRGLNKPELEGGPK
jgi:hypothetical protein